MKIKHVVTAAGAYLAGMAGMVSAAVSQNGTRVYVQPDAVNGYNKLNQFELFQYVLDVLDVLNYLVYITAIGVAIYCTVLVLINVVNGKRNPNAIKDELAAQEGLKKVVKIMVMMKIGLVAIDFLFYVS